MNEEVLQNILVELQGFRQEAVGRLGALENQLSKTNSHLDGLRESVVVLQQGVGDMRYELHNIKDILADRVIWQNDNISIVTKEGKVIYGVIQKTKKK